MKIHWLLLFTVSCCRLLAQKPDYGKMDSLMNVYAANDQFSGVVLVAEKGKTHYEKAFGYRDYAGKVAIQKSDVFELASVSKQFTAMVIMMLKEKGLLQYDDLVEKYLDIPYKGISIRNLLTHTSGLPDYMGVMDAHWDKNKVAGNDDIIQYLNQYKPEKLFEPGSRYLYSNTGYVLLASIAEKVSGRDFTEFISTEIFQKLHMKHTAIRSAETKAAMKNFAWGHMYVKSLNTFIRADSFPSSNYTIWLGNRKGPGRISSTAADLLKWDQALYTSKLISPESLEEAFTPMKLIDGKPSLYGFGWVLIPDNPAGKIVWHNGDNPGYKTMIARVLTKNRTLIILCNNATDKFDTLSKQLLTLLTR